MTPSPQPELGLDPTHGQPDLAFLVPSLEQLASHIPKTGRVSGRVAVPPNLSLALRPQLPPAVKPTPVVKDGTVVVSTPTPQLTEIFAAKQAVYLIEGKTLKIVLNACEDLTLTIVSNPLFL